MMCLSPVNRSAVSTSSEVATVSTVASVEIFPVVVVDMVASLVALLSALDCGVVLALFLSPAGDTLTATVGKNVEDD